jgi:Beta-propeller repeat
MHAPSIIALSLGLCSSTALAAPELDIVASAALGDELGSQPRGLDVDGDGNIVIAGSELGVGTLLRLDPDGTPIGAVLRLRGSVDDIAVDRGTGNVAVVGDAGLSLLGPDLELLWERPLASGGARARVGVGELGTVAVAFGGELHTIASDGRTLGSVDGQGPIAAIAVLDASDRVVITGSLESSGCDESVDAVSLAGFSRGGSPRWRAYDDGGCGRAATRGIDVARGDDGMVYLLAEVEGGDDVFSMRPGAPGQPARNVAFDDATARARVRSSLFAYYARFTADGEHLAGQYLGFADELSVVQPAAIAADTEGNVHVTGVTTHSLAEPDEVAGEAEIVDALAVPSGFYQVVASDFGSRHAWRQLDLDDMPTEVSSLALVGARAITLVQTSAARGGPMLVAWPDASNGPDKRPDRDDVGTFGYESGVSGADPTCYCDAKRGGQPLGWLALATCIVLARPRRRTS